MLVTAIRFLRLTGKLLGVASAFMVATGGVASAVTTHGALRMEVITAYNFVVDSNIESPAGKSPSAAHLGVKIHNDGASDLTNVVINIGDMTSPGAGTPGVFASRVVALEEVGGQYAGTFELKMPGGAPDAVRVIPLIKKGESVTQYFFVTYPLVDSLNRSVTGSAPVTEDDLWLNYDIWASAKEGATTRQVDQRSKVTMRNEISAMANKSWPNTASKVPGKYLDAIEASLGWRPETTTPRIPGAVVMEGIWYDFGKVGAGFDNDGDGLPDRNAWMQPAGDPSKFSPLAARLVKCYGLVIVKLNDGTEKLIPFEDQLYFEKIVANNTGAVGLVYYEFIPLNRSLPALLSPYQEVASGYNNEKFNADYGASVGSVSGTPPNVTFDKSAPTSITAGASITYVLSSANNEPSGSSKVFGWPELSLPLVFQDTIPSSLVYLAGSATSANTAPSGQSYTVSWSTNNGGSWVTTEPTASSVTTIRWTMSGSLAAGESAAVSFQTTVPADYAAGTVDNTACLKTGTEVNFACDTTTTRVAGVNSLGNFVWRDLDRDGVQDGGLEAGIPDIKVSLYADSDKDGVLDAGEPLYATTSTDAAGGYLFETLADGFFIVVVDPFDPQMLAGYTLPNATSAAIAVSLDPLNGSASPVSVLTADWPFIPALEVVKSVTPTTYGAGELVNFTIDLENHASPVPAATTPVQTAYVASVACKTNRTATVMPTNAQGAPDNAFARIDYGQDGDFLQSSSTPLLVYGNASGTITKVEMQFTAYLNSALATGASLNLLAQTGALSSTIPALTFTDLNTLLGNSPQTYTVDITSMTSPSSWTWPQIQALTGRLEAVRSGGPQTGIVFVDAIGFRVTTSAAAPSAGTYGLTSIAPLPLTDTFDNTKLQYVSASIAPTSVSGGTITWANLGPLNPGVRQTITVTFRALTPPDTNSNGEPDPTTTINNVSVTNAYFVSGRRTNDDTSAATITINPRGSIGDRIWWDLNANGVQNVGEPGLQNVLVTLSNGAQTRTDSNGNYLFSGLPNGTYDVTVVTSTLPWTTFTRAFDPDDANVNQRDDFSTVTVNTTDGVSTNDAYTNQDFGYDSALNVITGTIFEDNNGDGLSLPTLQSGENYLVGVTVTLRRDADNNGTFETVVATTTTNSSGYYAFSSLVDGSYQVVVTQPASTTQTLDPDANKNNSANVAASGGNLYPGKDFAYKPSGTLTLGDTLYYDWNGNGTQDNGEGGIPNVDVFLYEDTNGNGVIDVATDAFIRTSVTNASGVYGFGNEDTGLPDTGYLVAGNYLVVINTADPEFPANVTPKQDLDGVPDSKATVSLVASRNDVDFGYQPLGTGVIGNLIWLDADNDGFKDPSETGIDGVTVQLYRADQTPGVDTPYATTTTSGGGLYGFSGLPATSYVVYLPVSNFIAGGALVNLPLSSTTTVTADNYDNGSQSAVATAVSSSTIVLSAAETDNSVDFGFVGVGSVGDFVFYDSNGNGSQDFSEAGIAGVTVKIFLDANGDGIADSSTPVATTVTSAGSGGYPVGYYRFNNLTPGTYFVQVETATLPSGVTYTSDPDRDGVPVGTLPALPAGDHADSLVIVSSGSSYSGADFGYMPLGAIGDFVWLDLNQNGIADPGEPGLADVEITITQGATTYTVFTDFDGYWSAIVPDGTWEVTVLSSNFAAAGPLENMLQTFDADGTGTANVTSIVLASGVVTAPAGLAQGNLGIDFGYKLDGAYGIAGTILINDTRTMGTADDLDDFYDDGMDMDAGPLDEAELAGIYVYLYTTGGSFLGTTITDGSGNYSFSGLPAGNYNVIIGTTDVPLDNATLTTTTANNAAVSSVNSSSGTSVIQTVAITTSVVNNVDFAFISNVYYDFGDLPASYGITSLTQDGARHIIPNGGSVLYMGTAPDAETNGTPSLTANSDDLIGSDDENGVTFNASGWVNGTNVGNTASVQVTGSGWLVAWIDWNHDGDFLDPGEMIADRAVSTGTVPLTFTIPASTITGASQSWLSRFRLFSSQPEFSTFAYTGEASGGEIEDDLIEKISGASIGDLVWVDSDSSGTINGSETGVAGRIIYLYRPGFGPDGIQGTVDDDNFVRTQTTSDGAGIDADVDGDGVIDPVGYYRFTGLPAGDYTVTVTNPPAGYNLSYDENGIGTPNTTQLTLAANEQHITADFGYAPLVADLSGYVYFDTNADTSFGGDTPSAFVRVQLFTDPNGDGDPSDGVQVRETYTNTSGYYEFLDVPSGNYVVVEVNPPGATSVRDVVDPNDDRIPVTMVGVDVTGRDFLDTQPPVYALSGTVYADAATNDNVIGAGDVPIAGVTVKLFLDRDGDGLVSAGDSELSSTVTDSSGAYSFSGLPAGNYVVQETDPAGTTSDWDAAGSLTDNQIAVAIVTANVTARNFLDDGYLGSIGNLVWSDTNHNGLVDPGEPGISGIAVQLFSSTQTPGSDTPLATTTTNGSGIYGFSNLAPGSYKIYLPTPPATTPGVSDSLSTLDNQFDGDNNGTQVAFGGPVTSPVIALAAGENDATVDFGFTCHGTWEEWQFLNPLGGLNGPSDNPDGDAYDNLIEFAFNQPATGGAGDPYLIRPSLSAPGTIEAFFTRPDGATDNITYTLEYASVLNGVTSWSTLILTPDKITVVSIGNCLETVTIKDLEALTGSEGFVRIKAVLDTAPTAPKYTEVEGWTETTLGVCCRTYNNPYLRTQVYTGTVGVVDGQTLDFTGTGGGVTLTPGVAYYLEVTSGENEGQRFDVVSSVGNVLTLASDNDLEAASPPFNTLDVALPGSLTGDSVVIRRHWTLGEQFPVSGFSDAVDLTLADQIQTFAAGAWTTYWLYSNSGSPKWVKGEDKDTDQAASVLPPGQGYFVTRRASSTAILAYGEVRPNNFVSPLAAGTNLSGGGYPIDQSFFNTDLVTGSRQMSLSTGFFGSRDFKTADSIFVWKGDAVPQLSGYDTYYLLNRDTVTPAQIKWVKVGDGTLAIRDAEKVMLGDSSVFLRSKVDLHTYTVPSPWNP